ncbi:GlsB/YeaQ/YmgE family stress response membrane protein [Arsenicicoccus bolidensis]|uniref:GlsB/YeaQ/YmgE family stress response membrane protein n=1 Tax=Arsenicicoccus bolidensis TaxID=229480 RepID=A0ABS9Q2Y8_9MICO|nr:GlsB/YeaQ/YmgE family stress response membrane protein [Arsenicicoccus bolidensis]MCG7321463.1 GlsB/YeaQ/YmgE family stress response membrane protein [Arsenicicoccus bolidensis]
MLGTIITAIIIGAIIGGLARLVMPGNQNISILMTIALGILGSAIGSWLVSQFGYKNASGGIAWIAVLAGVVVAAILISIYLSMTGRKGRV